MLLEASGRLLPKQEGGRGRIAGKGNSIARSRIAVFRQKVPRESNFPEVFTDVGRPALIRIYICVSLMLPNGIPFATSSSKSLTGGRSLVIGALDFAMDMEPVTLGLLNNKMKLGRPSELCF